MKKILTLAFVLSCAMWVFAQTSGSQSSSSPSTQAYGSDNQVRVQGCLKGSNGSYTLTDQSGTTYQLAGDSSKLSEHVGHTVQITGLSPSNSGSSSGATKSSSGAMSMQPTLNVTSLKHISETCSSGQ